MPHIPEEIIEEIRSRADLVELTSQLTAVKKNGNAYWACCPFHHEKTPSFKIDPQSQMFYCFGCKKSGNVFHFVQEIVNTDFVGAVQWLANRYGIDIPDVSSGSEKEQDSRRQWRENCLKLLNDAANWYHANLSLPEADAARRYLDSRGLDDDAVNHFRLGYSPDSWDGAVRWATRLGYTQEMLLATGITILKEDSRTPYDRFRGRLMFPIQDELGRVVGFSARVLDPDAKTAKYVNSPETDFFKKGRLLYAFNFARQAFKNSGRALICEGQLDVIACHRAGLTYAIAAQGTAFTEFHARMLKRSTNNVTLAFDADGAGRKATVRTMAILHAEGLAVDVVSLPDGEDPDSIFRKGGASALAAIMGQTTPAIPFLFQSLCTEHDRTKPDEMSVIVRELLEVIRPITDPVVKAGHCQWLAKQLHIPENVVLEELNIVDKSHRSDFEKPTAQMPPKPLAMNQMLPFRMQQVGDATLQVLLELILHFDFLAQELANNEEVTAWLPDTSLGLAVNMVLALTADGEWELAEQSIVNSDLSADPTVGKTLASSEYSRLLPEEGDSENVLENKRAKVTEAFQDCINKLRISDLDVKIAGLKQAMQSAAGEEVVQMQRELCELIGQKNALKRR
ncbi:MAG: DNA primase [Victivallales bacterium]|nr:DNA primase [Victivallales bacterium]